MATSDPIGDLNLKINEVIARLEQDGVPQAERDSLGKALDDYDAARNDLILGDLNSAAAKVKAGDDELANAKAPLKQQEETGGDGGDTGAQPAPSADFQSRSDLSDVPTAGQSTVRPLTDAGLRSACQRLGVSAPEIWAVVFTECDPPYSGYFPDGRPQILFERHIFHRLTGGKFSSDNPDISNANPGGYGAGGAHQYDRLRKAMSLDEGAAIQSASWGMGQTLGTNYKTLGFASPQQLMDRMYLSEDEQLSAMVGEIETAKIASALSTHDWPNFARVYNGPNYAINKYDEHLRSWYEKFASGALPDLRVRAAQMYLMFLGRDPGGIDGMSGKRTVSAMNQFQAIKGIARTDSLDDATFVALQKDGEAVVPPKP